jgi:DNA-binding NtrC family response regulator
VSSSSPKLLFVEDEATFRRFAGKFLESRGFAVTYAGTGAEACEALASGEAPDLILLDLNLPDEHGLEVMRRFPRDLRVVVLTSYGDAATAVKALKAGAVDYLTKPIRLEDLRVAVESCLATARPEPVVRKKGRETETGEYRRVARAAEGLVGEHPEWLAAVRRVEQVARADFSSLLILGESGTGKTVLARHYHSLTQQKGAFVSINCPTIPEALLESELFGHEAGAFTGATKSKRGQVELAVGGTLLLDEVGELPRSIQPKLLQFLEDRTFNRVGGLEMRAANVRVVCATNRDLRRDVETGSFRTDLFYRLEVAAVELPPLRTRGDDVIRIAEACAEEFAVGESLCVLSDEAKVALRKHRFPGNVRELRNMIRRAVTFSDGLTLEPSDLELRPPSSREAPVLAAGRGHEAISLDELLNTVEGHYVQLAMNRTSSQRDAGALLGVDRFAVSRRMNRLTLMGGGDAVERLLAAAPAWAMEVLRPYPGALPARGINLPAVRLELGDRLIKHALTACEGNKARAATLLSMSRPSLVRRLKP